jgi:hypothetical protein
MKISDDWPGQLKALGGIANIVGIEPHREFAIMHSHNVKTGGVVFGIPALQNAEVANAIDAAVLPKVDQQNVPAVTFDGVGNLLASACVDPLRIWAEVWGLHWSFISRI